MTPNDFIENLEKLLDEYETANDNCIIGCFILFPSKILYQWNGERMVEETNFALELVEKEMKNK